jgi:hypothetical protein
VVLCVSQDHTCVHAKEVSELIGPPPPQWLVDIFRSSDFAWREARPSRILLANLRPEAFPVVENLLIEVSPVISVGTPRWILLQAIDDRLRNGRLICRQVRGKVRIRHVEEHKIYQIDPGGYGWCVNFVGYIVTPGSFHGLRSERTRAEENRHSQP